MAFKIDLHTHTTASDGCLNPGELVKYAKSKQIGILGITDHDTVDGIEEALSVADEIEITLIPGVEISVEYNPEMHILGYFSRANYLNIQNLLTYLKTARTERNIKIIENLNTHGIKITYQEISEVANGRIIGRPHIAQILTQKGYVATPEDAFEKYIATGKVAYVNTKSLNPKQVITEILKAGGVPVLAHPIYLNQTYQQLNITLSELSKFGLIGIETYYANNSEQDTHNLLKLASIHNLVSTGGSDFHCNLNSEIEIGIGNGSLNIDIDVYHNLMQKISALS